MPGRIKTFSRASHPGLMQILYYILSEFHIIHTVGSSFGGSRLCREDVGWGGGIAGKVDDKIHSIMYVCKETAL